MEKVSKKRICAACKGKGRIKNDYSVLDLLLFAGSPLIRSEERCYHCHGKGYLRKK